MKNLSVRALIAVVWVVGLTLGNALALSLHYARHAQWHYWSLDHMGFFNAILVFVGAVLIATAPSTKPRSSNH